MSTNTDTVPVTVTHIPLSREVYNEILSGLDELDESYGKTAETANARRWLHYQWLLAQSGQGQAVDVSSEIG